MTILNHVSSKYFKMFMKSFYKFWYLPYSLILSSLTSVSNCYAEPPPILSQLFDREIQAWEAASLIGGILLVLISPKKYRTKLTGIVAAIIVIYFMIIVVNIATGLEGLDLKA
jgi:hypothetical protein